MSQDTQGDFLDELFDSAQVRFSAFSVAVLLLLCLTGVIDVRTGKQRAASVEDTVNELNPFYSNQPEALVDESVPRWMRRDAQPRGRAFPPGRTDAPYWMTGGSSVDDNKEQTPPAWWRRQQ